MHALMVDCSSACLPAAGRKQGLDASSGRAHLSIVGYPWWHGHLAHVRGIVPIHGRDARATFERPRNPPTIGGRAPSGHSAARSGRTPVDLLTPPLAALFRRDATQRVDVTGGKLALMALKLRPGVPLRTEQTAADSIAGGRQQPL